MSFRMIGHPSHPVWEDTDPAPGLVAELAYVALADRDYRACWPMQALPGYELACVRDGALLLWTEGRCLRAGPGDVLVVPPRTPHREETPADTFSEVIYLGASLRDFGFRISDFGIGSGTPGEQPIRDPQSERRGRQSRNPQSEIRNPILFPLPIAPLLHLGPGNAVEQRLLQIAAEVQACAPGYARIVSGAVLEVFWHLARATQGIAPPAAATANDPALPGFGHEAQEYLARQHAEPLSIDDVARHFHLSRQYFSKIFRRVTGETPHAYLTAVRIRHARELLAESRLSIHAVATSVGFADPYYFTRCFRRHTGLSPTEYRQQAQAVGGQAFQCGIDAE